MPKYKLGLIVESSDPQIHCELSNKSISFKEFFSGDIEMDVSLRHIATIGESN